MRLNYIGSKYSLLDFIEESIIEITGSDTDKVFCDLFAGTGSVGRHFKTLGYKVVANDIQNYSYVINKHYIENHLPLKFNGLLKEVNGMNKITMNKRGEFVCSYLNKLKGVEGFIYKNYCYEGTKDESIQRNYFTAENSMKCDAIRKQIEKWKKNNFINDNEYYFLLCSLLESFDQYANTTCVYGAFLKKLKRKAQQSFVLKSSPLIRNKKTHNVYNDDINSLITKVKGDIFYLDPPYNHRQYATNYHLLETISKYDNPKIKGVAGLRDYENEKSSYCSRVKACDAFEDLITKADAKYIFLSYNNEGIMKFKDIKRIMSKKGKYGCFKKTYKRYKADNNRVNKASTTTEYLHYTICK